MRGILGRATSLACSYLQILPQNEQEFCDTQTIALSIQNISWCNWNISPLLCTVLHDCTVSHLCLPVKTSLGKGMLVSWDLVAFCISTHMHPHPDSAWGKFKLCVLKEINCFDANKYFPKWFYNIPSKHISAQQMHICFSVLEAILFCCSPSKPGELW